ncbi:hypothetical protein HK097_007563 [Rhizophlyctis rosea]|uniref:Uncharacterized protein n=1 Tax=Rhizophlyctis rosea TaxID=64517 RepID=A0AAD5SCX7_9FUNG|nr:hypothetical protein HK097_007563 [Rhizophlyctis rosea]
MSSKPESINSLAENAEPADLQRSQQPVIDLTGTQSHAMIQPADTTNTNQMSDEELEARVQHLLDEIQEGEKHAYTHTETAKHQANVLQQMEDHFHAIVKHHKQVITAMREAMTLNQQVYEEDWGHQQEKRRLEYKALHMEIHRRHVAKGQQQQQPGPHTPAKTFAKPASKHAVLKPAVAQVLHAASKAALDRDLQSTPSARRTGPGMRCFPTPSAMRSSQRASSPPTPKKSSLKKIQLPSVTPWLAKPAFTPTPAKRTAQTANSQSSQLHTPASTPLHTAHATLPKLPPAQTVVSHGSEAAGINRDKKRKAEEEGRVSDNEAEMHLVTSAKAKRMHVSSGIEKYRIAFGGFVQDDIDKFHKLMKNIPGAVCLNTWKADNPGKDLLIDGHAIQSPAFKSKRTIYNYAASLRGMWSIWGTDWIQDSCAQGAWLPEKGYDAFKNEGNTVLQGKAFFFAESFREAADAKARECNIRGLVTYADGRVVGSFEDADAVIVGMHDDGSYEGKPTFNFNQFLHAIPTLHMTPVNPAPNSTEA